MRHTGPALSPFNAWVLLKGMETLDLRVRKMCDNAQAIAEHLEGNSAVSRVLYPGLDSHRQRALAMRQMDAGGTMIAFEIKGGREAAFRTLNALGMIDISNNLGDAKSLVTHPSTTTHQRLSDEEKTHLGITEGLIRLSIGLEDPADLIDDLTQALAAK